MNIVIGRMINSCYYLISMKNKEKHMLALLLPFYILYLIVQLEIYLLINMI